MICDCMSADISPAFRRSNSIFPYYYTFDLSQMAVKRCCCNACRLLHALKKVLLYTYEIIYAAEWLRKIINAKGSECLNG